ncbi:MULTISPECIES: IclR family transcriptional regulator [unclassified Bordetella]|uniref:IclR family transcriptional regulator n=1 Tax=unclassified Bordetella TaxID=2630031 RepID=UPI00132770F7|nr:MULTISPECIES: IclR family transcriptional regulator [unclassified Bordetella]MVW72975.1 helix-turn-helix domain-containing protein [Bordetella sp. 15P40C-2]MVW79042.1 helix-turn-helix domain-containing protein [Bordetella sp. 02P26C-1]
MAEQDAPIAVSGVAALARGLEILRCFSAREPSLSNGELAAYTGLPKSTISRLTKTLVELGYLRHDAKNREYSVGPSVLALGYSALANLRVAEIARPHMQALADATGALISLATRDRLSMLYLEACCSDTTMTLRMGRGVRMPILSTSIGRAFLAALPVNEREYLVAALKQKGEPAVEPADLQALNRELNRYQRDGYCVSLGEWNADVNAAATPISWQGGSDVVVASISGPSFLITEELLRDRLIPRLMDLAGHISRQLE